MSKLKLRYSKCYSDVTKGNNRGHSNVYASTYKKVRTRKNVEKIVLRLLNTLSVGLMFRSH